MNTIAKKIVQKICAIAIIFIMVMADICIIGADLVSYAIDSSETNNYNIEYKAYFSNNTETLETTAPTDKNDLKIIFELGVKRDGYLSNAKLELDQNSNFKFKTDLQSEYISKINEKSITFKQINEGENRKIEVGIEFNYLQEFDIDYLSRISSINLTGTYVSSQNNDIPIQGKADVKVNWTYPEDIESALSSNIITNTTINEDSANKKLVQALISSKVENNSYPIRETKLEVSIPGNPESVVVHKRNTSATNGDQEFGTSNYTYVDGTLTITVQNGQNNKIVWQKDVEDKFVITIKYPDTAEITNSKIISNSTITTYNDKILNKNTEVTILDSKENFASINEIEMQKEIAKGKIYAGEEKNYTTKTEVNVDYANIIQKLKITEQEVKALKTEEERELPVNYKKIEFNKANIQSILGDNWNITIKDQANNSKNITNETETNENGNIIVQLDDGARKLDINTSKPTNNGVLKYEITKSIVKTNYTREQIKELNKIKDTNKITYTKNDTTENTLIKSATIDLKETDSKASLKVEPLTLTTSSEQEIHITAVLETDSEYRDLYKNPVVKIKLPKQINRISAQCNLMYGNGLQLQQGNFKINEENGQEVITINLTGEQKTYEGDAVKGATLNITARVELDKLSTNSSEEIVMTYTNENAISFVDGGQVKNNIDIVSQNSIILTNNIEEYNITTLGKESDKEIALTANSEAKNATVKMQIVNNEETDISNIAILGKIATIDNNILRTSKIKTNVENSRVYYTSVDNPTADINKTENNWKETDSNNSKYFLVIISSLSNGNKINLSYDINIGRNLPYNLTAEAFYKISYTNSLTNTKKEAESTKLILATGKVSEIRTQLTAKVQGKEINAGDEVKAGEIVTYTARITNSGATDITNLKIEANIPENTTLLTINPNYPKFDEEQDEYIDGEEYFNTVPNKNTLTQENVSIKSGKEYNCSFSVMVNENITEQKNIEAKFTFSENNVKKDEKSFSNIIRPAKLEVICMPYFRKANTTLQAGCNYIYGLKITNLTNEEQKNIKVILEKSNALEFRNIDWSIVGEGEDGESDKDEYEIQLENNNTLSFESIPANKTLLVLINTKVKATKENENQLIMAKISAQARDLNGNTYRSNEIAENIVGILATVESNSNTTTKVTKTGYVESGDQIKYNYKIKNVGIHDATKITITDEFSKYLDIESLKIDGVNSNYERESLYSEDVAYDIITIEKELKAGKEINIEIIAKVQSDLPDEEGDLQIVNNLIVYNEGIKIAEKSEKIYKIEMEKTQEPSDIDVDIDSNEDPNGISIDSEDGPSYTITGVVWKDENNDGLRDEDEELIEGIDVYAINVETSEIATNQNEQIIATTGADGRYTLTDLPQGNYIVAFEYDTNQYMVTTYQAEGVDESINSDAVKASRIVNGEERTAAYTDSIEVYNDIENIDLGLSKAKIFSLRLDKTISKIIVTNKNGSKTYNFDDSSIAKVEIASKELSGATVVIEYKMKVTNVGEIAGYAKSIVDYLPSSLTFNSSLNSDWYKKGNNLYTSSLSDVLIEPGETEEVTLTLTKKMTESNTGLTNNKAEIESSYNDLGIQNTTTDKDEEDTENAGTADAIIGVKTGTAVSYVLLTLTIIIIIGVMAYLVNKKLLIEKIEI